MVIKSKTQCTGSHLNPNQKYVDLANQNFMRPNNDFTFNT